MNQKSQVLRDTYNQLMNVLIAGDFFIADSFKNKSLIDRAVEELFASSDYRIVNLEAPLTSDEPKNKILKTGPHLRTSADTILPYLKKLNINMVNLANNHILDYGVKGLNDTIDTLEKNKISYVGAGISLKTASQPLTLEKDNLRIAILNFAENEWSIASQDKPGANPLDIIDNVHQIQTVKATHDKVICIIHGGNEYYHLPSPRMVKQYRFYADSGADAIVCHHTHCIGGYEIYNDACIIYSLGNFLFTLLSKHDEWYTGLVTQLKIKRHHPVSFEIFPVRQEKGTFKTCLINGDEKNAVLKKIERINSIIQNDQLLQQHWQQFVHNRVKQYLNILSPVSAIPSRYIRAGLNRLHISEAFVSSNYLKQISNLIRCEAHHDLLLEMFNDFFEKH